MTRERRARIAAAGALLLAATTAAEGASPFEGLYRLEGVTTSNDEYGAWIVWTASSYRLRFPGRAPLVREAAGKSGLRADLMVMCRADGRSKGYGGPGPLRADLLLPLHPDEPDVPSFFNPWFWVLVLAVGERETTPVRVSFDGRAASPSDLVRRRVDWSFPRPEQSVAVDPGEALRALASESRTGVLAAGPGTRLELRFDPDPGLARAAALMARHCEGGEPVRPVDRLRPAVVPGALPRGQAE